VAGVNVWVARRRQPFARTVWSRDEIETAIETLIELLDAADAPGEDLEPDAECGRGDLLLGDPADAE